MEQHRIQADGTVRASDNWTRGIPKSEYIKSLQRHNLDLWLLHRGYPGAFTQDSEEALCGIMFNSMGMLHELLKRHHRPA